MLYCKMAKFYHDNDYIVYIKNINQNTPPPPKKKGGGGAMQSISSFGSA